MSTAKFDTLSNLAGSLTVPVATVVQGSAKAWVNFNGTGTVAIRASFNVSSITDNGTGDYTLNFTTAFTDANYSLAGTACDTAVVSMPALIPALVSTPFTTTTCRVQTRNPGTGALTDFALDSVAIFR